MILHSAREQGDRVQLHVDDLGDHVRELRHGEELFAVQTEALELRHDAQRKTRELCRRMTQFTRTAPQFAELGAVRVHRLIQRDQPSGELITRLAELFLLCALPLLLCMELLHEVLIAQLQRLQL